MKKIYIALYFLLLACVSSMANPIDKDKAEEIAKQFIQRSSRLKAAPLANTKAKRQLGKDSGTLTEDAPFHIFNIGSGQGFVIVSGDDKAIPVLGYSDKGEFDWETAPDNLLAWMKLNEIYVERCREKAGDAQPLMRAGTPVQTPLLAQIKWGQGEPYNNLCPTYTEAGSVKHYYVGCVATAATQIMQYYKYPTQGTGSKSYVSNGQTLTADFGNTTYDWANMLDSYQNITATEAQKNAIATLSAHFGIAVEMEYMKDGSGAMSSLVPTALKDYYGYDAATTLRKRDFYSTDEWMAIIKAEIDARRPVYYAATSEDLRGGHAFVCDGYDSEGYVHINWGWYGNHDGYFLINHLEPSQLGEGGGSGSYNLDQEIITGIQPPTGGTTGEAEWPLYSSVHLRHYDSGNDLMLMGTIENFDTRPFTGDIAAVYVSNNQITSILKSEKKNIKGFLGRRSGYEMMTMRNIPKSVTGVTDGDGFVQLAFRNSETSEWQLMRTAIDRDRLGTPYVGRLKAKVSNGTLEIDGEDKAVPSVTVLGKLSPEDAEVYAKGAAVFPLTIRNESKGLRLENIVIRFQSATDASQIFDYENKVHIYDGSTESLQLLVKLSDDMPAGNYRLMAYEKGFPEYPFAVQEGESTLTVLPAETYPVLRLTQEILWSNAEGDTQIKQGDNFYIVLNARNYAVSGKVGVQVFLTDMANPDKSYLFQQQNAIIQQGEAQTFRFYTKLPVDPGTYRLEVKYLREDGSIIEDARAKAYDTQVTVGENTENIMLNAVALTMPDEIQVNEKVACSISFQAPKAFNGTIYVRVRQFTLTNGELAYMANKAIGAGEEKTFDFNYRPTVAPGNYIILVETKQGGTMGTVGQYKNCYKLFKVLETSGVKDMDSADNQPQAIIVEGCIAVAKAEGYNLTSIQVHDAHGRIILSYDGNQPLSPQLPGNGLYIVTMQTDKGRFVQKLIK